MANEIQEDLKPLQPMWTVIQVAKYLNIDRMTVYHWIKQGKLKSIRFSNRVRIPREEVEKLVANQVEKIKSNLN